MLARMQTLEDAIAYLDERIEEIKIMIEALKCSPDNRCDGA